MNTRNRVLAFVIGINAGLLYFAATLYFNAL